MKMNTSDECNCTSMCRDPVNETPEGLSLPLSQHHPVCPEHKKEKFFMVHFEGYRLFVEESEEDDFGSEAEEVLMTRDQFENIKELWERS